MELMYESPNFVVTYMPGVILVVDNRCTPPHAAALNGVVLEAFSNRVLRWRTNTPDQCEVEEYLAGLCVGAQPFVLQ